MGSTIGQNVRRGNRRLARERLSILGDEKKAFAGERGLV